jgi:HEAT repeat protein
MSTCYLSAAAVAGLTAALVAFSGDVAADVKVKDAPKHIETLRTTKDAKAKAAALTELGKIGQIQKSLVASAVPDMMKALEDKDAGVRAAAAKAVGMIDPDPKEAVSALVKLMKGDKDDSVKLAAIQGLAAMGESAKDASGDLRAVVKDDMKGRLGKAAKDALKTINPKKK